MNKTLKSCGLGLAALGIIYYALALVAWALLLYLALRDARSIVDIEWSHFATALAAPLLLGLCVVAIRYRDKPRPLALTIAATLVIAGIWSWYDASHENYQIGTHSDEFGWENYHVLGKGAHHTYINWPWLNR